jgi:hypothetical protein
LKLSCPEGRTGLIWGAAAATISNPTEAGSASRLHV